MIKTKNKISKILGIIMFSCIFLSSSSNIEVLAGGVNKLGIYYSYPSSLNSSTNKYDLKKVVNNFNEFNIIVLGAGLENSSHPDNANTLSILKGGKNNSAYIGKAYGYVTLKNASGADLKSKIDKWKSMGVSGIFFDEAGYDYLVPSIKKDQKLARSYQNEMIDYAHSKGLKVIMNGWNPDDIFGVKFSESKTKMSSGDSYLFESFTYNTDVVGYYDYNNQKSKITSALDYKKKYNTNIYCVGMVNKTKEITDDKVKTLYKNSLGVCDSIQITEVNFSANDGVMNNYYKSY